MCIVDFNSGINMVVGVPLLSLSACIWSEAAVPFIFAKILLEELGILM